MPDLFDLFWRIQILNPASELSWQETTIRAVIQFGAWLPVIALLVMVARWDARSDAKHKGKDDETNHIRD